MANNTSSTPSLAMAASSMVAALSGAPLTAPRALLVHLDSSGNLQHRPIGLGKSVLRIETELFDHLNSKPIATEFLVELRDYAAGRLAALDEAKRTGGFVIPRAAGQWEIAHVQAFQPVKVVE